MKKEKYNSVYFKWGLTIFITFLACLLLVYVMFFGGNIKAFFDKFSSILMPIFMGLATAYLLTPALNFIEYKIVKPFFNLFKKKDTKKRRAVTRILSIILTGLIFGAIIYGLFAMLLSQIIPSIANIVADSGTYMENINNWIDKRLADNPELGNFINNNLDKYSVEINKWINDKLLPQTSTLLKTLSMSVLSLLGVLWNFIIGFIISIYVLASKEKFAGQCKKIIFAFWNKETANVIINNFKFVHRTFIGFISGKILDSFIIGILCFIGTSILRTPYAALVSLIIGITNIIPFFGPFLGAVPSALLILVVDPLHPLNCLYFVIFVLVLQQVDGNILGPKIIANSTGLSGFWVIFAITFFGGWMGVPGMFIGVPLFAVIYAFIKSILDVKLKKKGLDSVSEDYINVASIDEKNEAHYVKPDIKLSKEEKQSSKYGKEFIISYDNDILKPGFNPVGDKDLPEEEKPKEVKTRKRK